MCLGCTASSAFWDAAAEDQQLESPEELKRRKLELLRERLQGRPRPVKWCTSMTAGSSSSA